MGLWSSMQGKVRIQIVSADPTKILTLLNSENIVLESVVMTDPLTVEATVSRNDFKRIQKIKENQEFNIKIINRVGIYWTGKGLQGRLVLVFGVILLIAMISYLPGRVFFVQVEGNSAIPTRLILEKAAACGIGFGSTRSEVRSEKIKNALLEAIPQLQWAGVNTSGCVATITVKEKTESDDIENDVPGVSSIVASRDGIIQECTVTRGNALCTVGQAVKAGQTLVSGYTDCGLTISATQAEAEIYALTNRDLQVLSLTNGRNRGDYLRSDKKYYLQIGKKLINFFNNSGISDTTCVKIYDKQKLTLPGGFSLPVVLITETRLYYDLQTYTPAEQDYNWVAAYSEEYLQNHMIAGKILGADTSARFGDEIYCYKADYACYEMIGQVKKEEIIQ